jgi:hypothetical protein
LTADPALATDAARSGGAARTRLPAAARSTRSAVAGGAGRSSGAAQAGRAARSAAPARAGAR